jgi:hypothetical protein
MTDTPRSPLCAITGLPFEISAREREYCEKYGVPLPELSPTERLRQLAAFRNRSHLYPSVCSFSGKKMLSQVPPTARRSVYDVGVWSSDSWDPKTYGRPYDFTRPFFSQLEELAQVVPIPNLAVLVTDRENSEYTNGITSAKNCYLLFAASYNEDCYFSRMVNYSRNIVDSLFVNRSELCYDCFNITECYNVRFSENCHGCSDSSFLFSCQGCKNCYGCTNLRNVEYHFYNQKLTRAEYLSQIANLNLGSYSTLARERDRFKASLVGARIKYYSGKNNEGSSGDYLNNTKNCVNSYYCTDCEDVENSMWLSKAKDCFSTWCFGNNSNLLYNSATIGDDSYNIRFCVDCWPTARDLEYCIYVGQSSSHCFGCISLKRSTYCILNQQYSKDDYFALKARIITQMRAQGEYGKFFPASFTPFPYNISEAYDFMPIPKAEATRYGYAWEDSPPRGEIPASTIPDHIKDIEDSILQTPLVCQATGKPFKIIKQELQYYRENNLPLPRVSPMERLRLKTAHLELRPLQTVTCAQCTAALQSVYDPKTRSILCEECYQHSVA